MLTLPTHFEDAANKSGGEPVWLVELPQVALYFTRES